MKKLIITLLCLAIVGGGGWFGYDRYMKQKEDKKIVDVVPVSYMMEPAENFSYGMSEMYGHIASANSQTVYVDTDKLVSKVLVKKGDEVKKGDVILEYDMTVVELELAKKENQVKVTEQNIKIAQKQVEEYKKYKPSEDAPKEVDDGGNDWPEYPDYPDYPDDPEPEFPDDSGDDSEAEEPVIPEEPEIPLLLVDNVIPAFVPFQGTGTEEDPYVINCTPDAVISRSFMMRVSGSNEWTVLRVYGKGQRFLYQWVIDPAKVDRTYQGNMTVTDGLTVDAGTGKVTLNGDKDVVLPGRLEFSLPEEPISQDESSLAGDESAPEESEPEESEPEEIEPEYQEPEYQEPEYVPEYTPPQNTNMNTNTNAADNNDYIYSKAEISRMITEKQNEIKEMELELKSQKIELENAKKQQSDGKVVAQVDGIVKKIGTPGGSSGEEDMDENFEEEYDEDYEDTNSNAFAIIEGEGGVEVVCEISELRLADAQPGTVINVSSWETGAFSEAEVTSVDEEPASYENTNWGDNPNSSTYTLHAKILDSESFSVGDWVSCTLVSQSEATGSVYLPIHYVRQEGGNYYIMKDDGTGHLEKQYVRAGKIMYGYYIEIKGGLKATDMICFPFGNDVKEGVKTRETENVIYPEYY